MTPKIVLSANNDTETLFNPFPHISRLSEYFQLAKEGINLAIEELNMLKNNLVTFPDVDNNSKPVYLNFDTEGMVDRVKVGNPWDIRYGVWSVNPDAK